MDLDLDNYSVSELTTILQVPKKDININILQQCLYNKIEQIKEAETEDLPENKEYLIEFYTKGMFKLLKNIALLNTTEKDSSIISGYENVIGNIYKPPPENVNNEFIGVQEKLLPPLIYNPVAQENSNFVAKHVDHGSMNTFNSNLKQGVINPLTRKSFKKILNINTKFRNNYTTTSSTNFSINLPSTIKKVTSIQLIDSQFPEMVYTVSDKLGSNSFTVDSGIPSGPHIITISNGSYSSETIVTAINSHIHMLLHNVELSFDEITGLMTFTQLGGFPLILDFNYIDNSCPQSPSNIYKDQLTLGWLLGFRGNYIKPINPTTINNSYKVRNAQPSVQPNNYLKNNITCCPEIVRNQTDISFIYNSSSSYTAESLFDPHGSRYFLISINDFQNNHNNIFISPFQHQTLADNNILAKISTDCCNKCCIEQPKRIYFGPTDIAKLHIIIYDEFGRIVDINNADYSLTLELQIIYDL
jgi:hypothetical protein